MKMVPLDRLRNAYDFLLVFYRNFVPKFESFWDIRLQKCRDLENRIRGPSTNNGKAPTVYYYANATAPNTFFLKYLNV